MTGTVEGYKPSLSGIFWIRSEDGEVYFSHRYHTKERSNCKRYLYNGNHATFSVVDEGGDHLKAVDVWFDEIDDPDAELKRERRIEDRRRQQENELRKEEARVRRLEEQVKYYQKIEFESKWLKYVIQYHDGVEWKNYYSGGKLVVFSDVYKAQDYVKREKPEGVQMRAKKCKVVKTRTGYQVKPI